MPAFETLENYARKVEKEMSASKRKGLLPSKSKRCPDCLTECDKDANSCHVCHREFPKGYRGPKIALNALQRIRFPRRNVNIADIHVSPNFI